VNSANAGSEKAAPFYFSFVVHHGIQALSWGEDLQLEKEA
jgi:hypothetical protein